MQHSGIRIFKAPLPDSVSLHSSYATPQAEASGGAAEGSALQMWELAGYPISAGLLLPSNQYAAVTEAGSSRFRCAKRNPTAGRIRKALTMLLASP